MESKNHEAQRKMEEQADDLESQTEQLASFEGMVREKTAQLKEAKEKLEQVQQVGKKLLSKWGGAKATGQWALPSHTVFL